MRLKYARWETYVICMHFSSVGACVPRLQVLTPSVPTKALHHEYESDQWKMHVPTRVIHSIQKYLRSTGSPYKTHVPDKKMGATCRAPGWMSRKTSPHDGGQHAATGRLTTTTALYDSHPPTLRTFHIRSKPATHTRAENRGRWSYQPTRSQS